MPFMKRAIFLAATIWLTSCGGGGGDSPSPAPPPNEQPPTGPQAAADKFADGLLRQTAPTATIYSDGLTEAVASAILSKALAIMGEVWTASAAQRLAYNPFSLMAQTLARGFAGTPDWIVYASMPSGSSVVGAYIVLLNDSPQVPPGSVRTGNPLMVVPGQSLSGTQSQVVSALGHLSVETYRNDLVANTPVGWDAKLTTYQRDDAVSAGDRSTWVVNSAYDPYGPWYVAGQMEATVLSIDATGAIVHKLGGTLAQTRPDGQVAQVFPGAVYGLNSVIAALHDYANTPDEMVFNGIRYPQPLQFAGVTRGGEYSLTAMASVFGGLDSTMQFALTMTDGDPTTLNATVTPNVSNGVDPNKDTLTSAAITYDPPHRTRIVTLSTRSGAVKKFTFPVDG